ncbi:hypothetical protein [Paenibacillus larvae]|uniref:Uncharacterized protein n=1 Tax=Paenibacillus larvae subsp. larvae DSM 25430 TaxID=697284 RepID=V9W6G6_9BACL|nr:hypothetical protein [Paenibacillus larvae]AHD05738.1 hypothetical protein ERIC2_c19420 [Paenibacillus larvae subsp. larvae DSM 25430]MDR5569693.1 hypothetical protein [Paenibacillus larvae]MDR5596020.1 hypothetical protein [Paenibacillus larvae]
MFNEERKVRTITRTLTVTGIYFDSTDEYSAGGMFKTPLLNKRNEILTTFDTVLNPLKSGETGVQVSANYYLKKPSMLKDLKRNCGQRD